VTTFGMSDVIGLVAIGDSEQEVFLGREIMQRRGVSEHTARLVDQEMKRMIDEAHERARKVLEQNKDLLEDIAQALLERETLGRTEIEILSRREKLPPLVGLEEEPVTLMGPKRPVIADKSARPLGIIGGEGPLPGPAPGYHDQDGERDPL